MSEKHEMLARVTEILREQSSYDGEITFETNLFSDLNFDSLDAAEFAMNLEDAFDVEVPDEEASEIRTVGQAVDLLQRVRTPV